MTTTSVDARSRPFDVVLVRRRDARRLRQYGPPPGVVLPPAHGGKGDPRYPSPHNLRAVLSFIIDLALHLGCAVAAFVALTNYAFDHPDRDVSAGLIVIAGPATFIVVSFVHRVFVQRIFHTTLGKAVTGLRLIRDDTGGRPTLWSLTVAWLAGALGVLASLV